MIFNVRVKFVHGFFLHNLSKIVWGSKNIFIPLFSGIKSGKFSPIFLENEKEKKEKMKKTNWKIIFIQMGDAKINYNFIIKNHQINHFPSSTNTICRNTTYFFLLFSSIYSSFFRVHWKKVRVQKYELWQNLPKKPWFILLFDFFNVK